MKHIESDLDESNCSIIFDQLVKIGVEDVATDLVQSFIKIGPSAALLSDSFLQMEEQSLIRLLNTDYLNVSEIDILRACSRWAQAKADRSGREMREEFEGVKCLINFADLTMNELSKACAKANLKSLLDFNEIGSLFYSLSLSDKTIKPAIEYKTSRRTIRPFVADCGPYETRVLDSSTILSCKTRRLISDRRILVSSICSFISAKFEDAMLSISDEKNGEELQLVIERESHESKWIFHLHPYLMVDPEDKYLLKFTSSLPGPNNSSTVTHKRIFENESTRFKMFITPVDAHAQHSYHFIEAIHFYAFS